MKPSASAAQALSLRNIAKDVPVSTSCVHVSTSCVQEIDEEDAEWIKLTMDREAGKELTRGELSFDCIELLSKMVFCKTSTYHRNPVTGVSNKRSIFCLGQSYQEWRGLNNKITEREAARFDSSVGGQGMLKCNCKGKCDTRRCKCI